MKLLPVVIALLVAGAHGSSLLEMGQVLWNRVLDGGYNRVGKLDPLRVPVVKVDQSEGSTSYRVLLRNLEVKGLNNSTVESVHIARGSLKSNLTDNEAGYVSYNQQRGLDSIRYRFHTLVKEPKQAGELDQSASEQFDRIVEYDPVTQRARDEAYPQRYSTNYQQQQVYNSTHRPVAATSYSNMRVAVNPNQKNPSQVRVVYTNNYKYNPQQEEIVRPCIGACRVYHDDEDTVKYVKGSVKSYNQPQPHPQGVNFGSPIYQNQRNYDNVYTEEKVTTPSGIKVQYKGASFSSGSPDGQSKFVIKGANDQPSGFSGSFGNGQFAVKGQNGDNSFAYRPQSSNFNVKYENNGQFAPPSRGEYEHGVKGATKFSVNNGDGFGLKYNGNSGTQFGVKGGDNNQGGFSGNYNNGQFSVSSNGGENYGANGQRINNFGVKGGAYNNDRVGDTEDSASNNHETKVQFDGSNFSGGVKSGGNAGLRYTGNLGNAQFSNGDGGFNFNYGGDATQMPAYVQDFTGRPAPINGDTYYDNPGQPGGQPAKYQAETRSQFAESTTSAYVEEFQPFKSPLIRLEKQPGYVDIVYSTKKRKGSGPEFENLKEGASDIDDPKYYAFEKAPEEDLPENHRYNYTDGEPLIKQYKADIDSRRIKDLERYAKEYQEKQGYFEEGMELIYHFGNLNATAGKNETLNRKKRQHNNDKEEEDVMHVIVRIRVPELIVKSGYALTGKVGKQPVRGNGLLAGNFTDVIADFTVELKQVDNKTMIVRAARAKLVAREHKIKLQGMDEKGPAEAILNQGLMAAEAVAAMIADDLASKALNEGNADAQVYKMYKNLPVVEKS